MARSKADHPAGIGEEVHPQTTAITQEGPHDLEPTPQNPPRSAAIARRGVRTGEDFADLMSALMSDVIEGALDPGVTNAAVNAGGKLLKVVEMQYRYGRQSAGADIPGPMILSHGRDSA